MCAFPIESCAMCAGQIQRQVIAADCLPVPNFGELDADQVKVATIAINPAISEFYRKWGYDRVEFRPRAMRLPVLQDYRVNLRTELYPQAIDDAQSRRDRYFRNCPHSWFVSLGAFLREIDASWSYESGSAVHIDLVACSTFSAWRKVARGDQYAMLKNCRQHFLDTLSNLAPGTWLLFNGIDVRRELNHPPVSFQDHEESVLHPGTLYRGFLRLNRTPYPYLGWLPSINSWQEKMTSAAGEFCQSTLRQQDPF